MRAMRMFVLAVLACGSPRSKEPVVVAPPAFDTGARKQKLADVFPIPDGAEDFTAYMDDRLFETRRFDHGPGTMEIVSVVAMAGNGVTPTHPDRFEVDSRRKIAMRSRELVRCYAHSVDADDKNPIRVANVVVELDEYGRLIRVDITSDDRSFGSCLIRAIQDGPDEKPRGATARFAFSLRFAFVPSPPPPGP
jgi:hypothetical protein